MVGPGWIMHREKQDEDHYTILFVQFSDAVEKWMKRALICLFVLLTLFQCLLQFQPLRSILCRVERLEGIPYRTSIR